MKTKLKLNKETKVRNDGYINIAVNVSCPQNDPVVKRTGQKRSKGR